MLKEKVRIIINPISGTGRQTTALRAVKRHIDKRRFDFEIAKSEYPHHAEVLARDAAEKGYDIVVAVGGDGTVNDVASGIFGTETRLAIIPCGSGNGLARCLNIPLTFKNAVELLNYERMKKVDTISINDKLCVSLAGIGFDALVAQKFQETPDDRGLRGYLDVILSEYPKYRQHSFSMEIDGKKISRKVLFISFANSNQFGYNAQIAPDAKIDDGLADICIVKKVPLPLLPLTAQLLYTHNFERSHHVEILQGENIKVTNNILEWVNIDGEAMKLGKVLNIKVNNKSLNVIC